MTLPARECGDRRGRSLVTSPFGRCSYVVSYWGIDLAAITSWPCKGLDMLEPISKKRLSQMAVEQIKEYIEQLDLQGGYQLPSERQLSELLGISRNSVREALRVLEIMDVIEIKPGSGSYVKDTDDEQFVIALGERPKDIETLFEHFEIRQILEPRAASLAAERATAEIIYEMELQIEAFSQCSAEGDLTGMILADTEFHRLIAEATQNKMLGSLNETITHYLHEGWKGVLPLPGRAKKTIEEHSNILAAIKAGDAEQAALAMSEHLGNAVRDLAKAHHPQSGCV